MKIRKLSLYILIITLILVTFTGCSKINDEEKNIQDKTNEEIDFLEDKILTVVNRYAEKQYNLQEGGINWEVIEKDIESINISLDTIILDLSEVQISNNDLVNFSNELANLNIAVSSKDEYQFMQRCSYLYSLLPTYLEKYSEDKNKINIMKLKSLMVSSFVQSNFFDWENAKATIVLAENKYKEMMDDVDYMEEYSYNLNKVYVLLQEMKNAINLEEADLSRIKYINFISKI